MLLVWLRRLFKIIVGLALLVFIAIAAVWTVAHKLAPVKIKTLLETSVTEFLGRKLTIGDVSVAPFPAMELRARAVKLVDKNGRVIVDCPEVTARASILSVLKLHIGVEEVRFKNADVSLWFERDGRLNVERIADEIAARPAAPSSSSPLTILLHRFTMTDGRLRLSDVAGAPPSIDGRLNGELTLKFSPLGLRGMPFGVDVDEGEKGAHVQISGQIGEHPRLQVRAERVPAQALSPRLTLIGPCAGAADIRLDWSVASGPTLEFGISPHSLCREKGTLPERLSGRLKKQKSAWKLEVAAIGAGTALNFQGNIPPAPEPMTFNVTGASASVEAVSAWSSAFAAVVQRGEGSKVEPSTAPARALAVKVDVASATFQNIHLSNVNFEVNRGTDNIVWIRPIHLNVFSGVLEGVTRLQNGIISVDFHAKDVSLNEFIVALGSNTEVGGRLSATLTGDVPVGAPVISSFTGHGEVWFENLTLARVPGVVRAITSASFVKIEKRLKGESRQKFEPAKGNGTATMKDGVAQIKKLWLENRVLRLGFNGKVNYIAKTTDGILVVQALTAADQLVSNVPIVRDIVLNEEKTITPLWFHIEGPWGDAKARSMPAKTIEAPVENILKGIISLPKDLYDRARGKKTN